MLLHEGEQGAVELSSEEEEERAVAELEAAGHTVPEDLSAPEQETPDVSRGLGFKPADLTAPLPFRLSYVAI